MWDLINEGTLSVAISVLSVLASTLDASSIALSARLRVGAKAKVTRGREVKVYVMGEGGTRTEALHRPGFLLEVLN